MYQSDNYNKTKALKKVIIYFCIIYVNDFIYEKFNKMILTAGFYSKNFDSGIFSNLYK